MFGYKSGEGMSETVQESMLSYYLSYRKEVLTQQYIISSSGGGMIKPSLSAMKKAIKSEIDLGRPILVNGHHHSTVAWGYDDESVYVDTGWGFVAKTSWSTFEYNSKNNESFIKVYFHGPHVHCPNYYSIDNYYYYCYCGAGWDVY